MELSVLDMAATPPPSDASAGIAPGEASPAVPFRRLMHDARPDESLAGWVMAPPMPPQPLPQPPVGQAGAGAAAGGIAAAAAAEGSLVAGLEGTGGASLLPAMEDSTRPLSSLAAVLESSTPRRWQVSSAPMADPASLATSLATATSPLDDAASWSLADASLPVDVPGQVGSSVWGEALGDRLALLAAEGTQRATLRLSPEDLGPVEVSLTLGDDRIGVQFLAQHADTRQALQDSLPRLRELFAQAGLPTLDAGVSQHSPRRGRTPEALTRSARGELAEPRTTVAATVRQLRLERGLLDTWA